MFAGSLDALMAKLDGAPCPASGWHIYRGERWYAVPGDDLPAFRALPGWHGWIVAA